jgi:hypothetical protein
VIGLLKEWDEKIGVALGLDMSRFRYITGSVGALESQIESEFRVETLAELDDFFGGMSKLDFMAEWSTSLEPYVVSATNRWEVFREL